MYIIFKLLGHSKIQKNSIIKRSGLPILLNTNLDQLKKSTFSKNKSMFVHIEACINNYLLETQNLTTPKFSELLLWQAADKRFSLATITSLTLNHSKLLDIFEDTHDILHISKKKGASKVIDLLSDSANTLSLIQKLNSIEIIKIAKHHGSRQVFDLFLQENAFDMLVKLLGREEIIKMCCNDGARQVLELLKDNRTYQLLLTELGKDNLIAIANNTGSRQTLNLILEPDSYQPLLELLGKELFIKIARHDNSRQVFDLLLKKKKFKVLIDSIGHEDFLKICKHHGSKQVLDILSKNNTFDSLVNLIGKKELIKISSHDGSAKMLQFILENPQFDLLINLIGVDNFITIASFSGASQVFDLLLDKDSFETLKDRLGIEDLIKASSHIGALPTLHLILNKSTYDTLVSRIGKNNLSKIANKSGSRQVLDILINDDSFDTLVERLGRESLIRLACHEGSKQVLSVLLNLDSFNMLCSRLGKNNVPLVATVFGAKKVFDIFLKDSTYLKLLSRLGEKALIKIAIQPHSNQVFGFFLKNETYSKLLNILGHDTLIKIASTYDSKHILELLLKKGNFNLLINRLGIENFINLSTHSKSGTFLDYILDSEKWSILSAIFDKTSLSIIGANFKLSKNLKYTIDNYSILSKFFNKDSLSKFVLLPNKDQVGLYEDSLHQLMTSFHFKEEDVLALTKLAGRFIPDILRLFQYHPDDIQQLFMGEDRLPFPIQTVNLNDEKVFQVSIPPHLSSKDICLIGLVELHKYSNSDPFCLEELIYLKQIFYKTNSKKNHFEFIKRLLKITSDISSPERKEVWGNLIYNNYLSSDSWIYILRSLPPRLRQWFIESGEKYLKSLTLEVYIGPDTSLTTNTPDDYFMLQQCLKYPRVVKYLSKIYPIINLDFLGIIISDNDQVPTGNTPSIPRKRLSSPLSMTPSKRFRQSGSPDHDESFQPSSPSHCHETCPEPDLPPMHDENVSNNLPDFFSILDSYDWDILFRSHCSSLDEFDIFQTDSELL